MVKNLLNFILKTLLRVLTNIVILEWSFRTSLYFLCHLTDKVADNHKIYTFFWPFFCTVHLFRRGIQINQKFKFITLVCISSLSMKIYEAKIFSDHVIQAGNYSILKVKILIALIVISYLRLSERVR